MIAQILPADIANLFSTHKDWLFYASAGWLLFQNCGRIYQALRSGGGVVGIWRGLVYGTNTTTIKQDLADEIKKS